MSDIGPHNQEQLVIPGKPLRKSDRVRELESLENIPARQAKSGYKLFGIVRHPADPQRAVPARQWAL
jgi:hypothetical protein